MLDELHAPLIGYASTSAHCLGSPGETQSRSEHLNVALGTVPWRCLVPQEAVPIIIGKGGRNIRQTCHTSGAEVEIPKKGEASDSLADKVVTIKGTEEQQEKACLQVLKKLLQVVLVVF